MVRQRPPLEQLADIEHGCRTCHQPAGEVLRRHLSPIRLSVGFGPVERHRSLQRSTRHRIGPCRDSNLPDAGPALPLGSRTLGSQHGHQGRDECRDAGPSLHGRC
jgi:hypothetical protein